MLTAELSAGLGNRLYALASAWHLAHDLSCDLTIVWDIGNGLGARFNDLFVLSEDVPVQNIYREGIKRHPLLYLQSLPRIHKLQRETTQLLRSGSILAIREAGNGYDTIRRMVEVEKNTLIDAYAYYFPNNDEIKPEHFAFLSPSMKVKEHASPSLELITEHSYGLHIRRSDHKDAIAHSPLKLFTDKINDILLADTKADFYLSTDDVDTRNELVRLYGPAKIHYQANVNLSRDNTSGAICAYTDMLCLSSCKEIIGSYGSTFSKLSSLLGDKPLTVLSNEPNH